MAPTSTTTKTQIQLGFEPSTSHMIREHSTIWAIEKNVRYFSVFSLCVCLCVCLYVRTLLRTVWHMELIFLPQYLSILIKMQRQSFCSNSEIWGSYAPFSILSKNQFSQKFETAAATKFKLSICTIRPMSPDSLFFEKNDFCIIFWR